MNGKEAYDLQYINKIDGLFIRNKDKQYLKGFFYYLNDLAFSTKYDYLNYVISFMNFNKKDISQLELDDYTEFLGQIRNRTASYQISVYSGLKKFSKYLLASRKNSEDPMNYVPRPKFKEGIQTIQKREIGFLEKGEIKSYINTVQKGAGSGKAIARQKDWKDRDLLIIMLFLNTGIRCSALYKINVEDINLQDKTLITIDKGDKIQQHNLTDELISYIIMWLDQRDILLDNKQENALFISNQRTRMDQSSISRVVKKYAGNIKGKHITPHKLRATYGTHLLKETNDIYFVQECMNHSSPKTTELYIRGTKNENRKNAATIMSNLTLKNTRQN